jgi:hypothetical protein
MERHGFEFTGRKSFFFPGSDRLLLATTVVLRSFYEDASIFTRWNPLKSPSIPKPFKLDSEKKSP